MWTIKKLSSVLKGSLCVFLKDLFIFISCVWMVSLRICMCTTCMQCSWRPEEGTTDLRTGVMDGCELSCECWELNPGPLQLNHWAMSPGLDPCVANENATRQNTALKPGSSWHAPLRKSQSAWGLVSPLSVIRGLRIHGQCLPGASQSHPGCVDLKTGTSQLPSHSSLAPQSISSFMLPPQPK